MWCSIRWTARGRVDFSALCDRAGCWLRQEDRRIGDMKGILSYHHPTTFPNRKAFGGRMFLCKFAQGRLRDYV
jgi:hypothetical protein